MSPAASTKRSAAPLYRVRISLLESDPEIWRLIELSSALRLDEVHEVVQCAMGWLNSHLHAFSDQNPYERPHGKPGAAEARHWLDSESLEEGLDGEDETSATLGEVLTETSGPLFYNYDFGDSWLHALELIEVIDDPDAAEPLAAVIRGARACPLEDSGGVNGYADKLEALADPSDERFEWLSEWVAGARSPWAPGGGGPFDPEAFDVAAANTVLAEWAQQRAQQAGGAPAPAASDGRALNALLQHLPAAAQRDLLGFLRRGGAEAEPEISDEDAAAMVAPFLWLLRRVGTEGLPLTEAGWLPPAVVREAMQELGWADRWVGQMNRESQTLPIYWLRGSAQQYGLLRKFKGRLVLTAAAKKLLENPRGLWDYLAAAIVTRQGDEAERDAVLLWAAELATGVRERETEMYAAILWGLEVVGWRFDATTNTSLAVLDLLRDARHTLRTLGAFETERTVTSGTVRASPAGRAFARAMLRA